MIKCKNCDHEFEKGNFCPKCGTKVAPDEPKIPEAPVAQQAPTPSEAPAENYAPAYTQPPVQEPAPTPVEENPYEIKYPDARNSAPYYPPAEEPVSGAQAGPQQRNVQQSAGQAAQPQQYQYQQYAYAQEPKKGMTAGKIVALVASIFLAAALFFYGIPFGLFVCGMVGEDDIANPPTEIDKIPHTVSEAVMIDSLEYTISDIKYTDTFNNKKLDDGKTYLTLTVSIRNTGKNDFADGTEYQLYADNVSCKVYTNTDYDDFYDSYEIAPGKILKTELTYIVPTDSSTITLTVKNYTDDYPNMKQFTYSIK